MGLVRRWRQITWMIVVGLLPGSYMLWCAPKVDRKGVSPPVSVVYLRPRNDRGRTFDLMLLASARASSGARLVCSLRNAWLHSIRRQLSGPPVPDAVGMLPSPAGDWLLVWDGGRQPAASGSSVFNEGITTEWSVIRLQDGKRTKIAVSKVDFSYDVAIIPSWSDSHTVQFRDVKGPHTVDVLKLARKAPLHLQPFPGPEPSLDHLQWTGAEGPELLTKAAGKLRGCVTALRQMAPRLDLKWNPKWSANREEWACLLATGVPLPSRTRGWLGPKAQASLSPDGSKLAVADRGVQKRLTSRERPSYTAEVDGARLRVVEVASGRRLWEYQAFPKAIEYAPGAYHGLANPPMPLWTNPSVQDLRWSADGRYLSFTLYGDPQYEPVIPTVHVVDATAWREVLVIPHGVDVFVLPEPETQR